MLLQAIDDLVEDGLLSDERFAESYFQSRKNKGLALLESKMNLVNEA
jgi:SOS response regulatory protein OraA/RecX